MVIVCIAQSSGDVRLVDSSSTSAQAGRLEIFWHGQWSIVCSDSLGVAEAQVVCRQLGLNALKVGSVKRLGYVSMATCNSFLPIPCCIQPFKLT